jgi:hypothetical protein
MCLRKIPDFGRMTNVPSTFKDHLLYGGIESEAQKKEKNGKDRNLSWLVKVDPFIFLWSIYI